MNKILITAGTTSLALKIKNLLSTKMDVILGTSDEIPSVLEQKIIKLSNHTSNSFTHELLKIALDNNLNYILPLRLKEIEILSQSYILFEEYDIKILAPQTLSLDTIEIVDLIENQNELVLNYNHYDLLNNVNHNQKINGLGLGLASNKYENFKLIAL